MTDSGAIITAIIIAVIIIFIVSVIIPYIKSLPPSEIVEGVIIGTYVDNEYTYCVVDVDGERAYANNFPCRYLVGDEVKLVKSGTRYKIMGLLND